MSARVPIIPVLVDGARPFRAEELPRELRDLVPQRGGARRRAVDDRHRATRRRHPARCPAAQLDRRLAVAGGAIGLVLVAALLALLLWPDDGDDNPFSEEPAYPNPVRGAVRHKRVPRRSRAVLQRLRLTGPCSRRSRRRRSTPARRRGHPEPGGGLPSSPLQTSPARRTSRRAPWRPRCPGPSSPDTELSLRALPHRPRVPGEGRPRRRPQALVTDNGYFAVVRVENGDVRVMASGFDPHDPRRTRRARQTCGSSASKRTMRCDSS